MKKLLILVVAAEVLLASSSAFASPGDTIWTKRYNGPGNSIDSAEALAVSPDGSRVFVAGYSTGSATSYDYATIGYDASTGARLWAARYNGPGNSYDSAAALVVSPDGTAVFVTGGSTGSAGDDDYATFAYDSSTGATLWASRYNGPGNSNDNATAVEVSPDGSKVFVTGGSFGSTGGYDYATIAYDASTGARMWIARYKGPANDYDVAGGLGVSPDGSSVFVTGYSLGSGDPSAYATVAYDSSTGTKLWIRRYNGPANSESWAFSLGVSSDGTEVFVTGFSYGSTSGSDYATIAYDASTGATLWAARYNGPANSGEIAWALQVSPDGTRVFVTGQSAGSTGFSDYATIAYDSATGARVWVKRYSGSANGDDTAISLGVSPDGTEVFVTGRSARPASGNDYATIAYDASTGAKLWVERYNGPGNSEDSATSLGVSPDGTEVFVTGHTTGLSGGLNYTTIAYAA